MTNTTDDFEPEANQEKRESESGGQGRHRRGHRSHDHASRGRGARKERVLHTRISEQLSEDIRRFADDLRVPASNLVRNVLEEVFTMVDSVSGDVGEIMDDLVEEAEGVRERVGRHVRSRRSGRSRRRSRRGFGAETDVEDELRRDEAAEAQGQPGEAAAEESASEAPPTPQAPPAKELFPDVLGWQPLVLNQDMPCGRCDRALSAGESAFLGMTTGGMTETALCGRCVSSAN
jgi:hypothetical protein